MANGRTVNVQSNVTVPKRGAVETSLLRGANGAWGSSLSKCREMILENESVQVRKEFEPKEVYDSPVGEDRFRATIHPPPPSLSLRKLKRNTPAWVIGVGTR